MLQKFCPVRKHTSSSDRIVFTGFAANSSHVLLLTMMMMTVLFLAVLFSIMATTKIFFLAVLFAMMFCTDHVDGGVLPAAGEDNTRQQQHYLKAGRKRELIRYGRRGVRAPPGMIRTPGLNQDDDDDDDDDDSLSNLDESSVPPSLSPAPEKTPVPDPGDRRKMLRLD